MFISELLEQFGLSTVTPPAKDFEISGVRPLDQAGEGDLSFLSNRKYKALVLETKASAVLVKKAVAGCPALQVLCRDPYVTLAKVLRHLYPEPEEPEGIHPTAVVSEKARIGKGCMIGPFCVVEDNSVIGDDSVLLSHVTVSSHCRLGSHVKLFPNVVLYPRTRIGDHVRIHANTVIGSDGFGYAQEGGRHLKIPQIGGVRIGDHVEIGSNVSVDRGALADTVIGDGAKIDNMVQVGHGVKVGDHAILVSQTGISGSASIGKHTILAGKVGVTGHVHIGNEIVVMGDSVVTKDLDKPGRYAGNPAIPHMKYQRQLAQIRKLPELKERVKALEEAAEK